MAKCEVTGFSYLLWRREEREEDLSPGSWVSGRRKRAWGWTLNWWIPGRGCGPGKEARPGPRSLRLALTIATMQILSLGWRLDFWEWAFQTQTDSRENSSVKLVTRNGPSAGSRDWHTPLHPPLFIRYLHFLLRPSLSSGSPCCLQRGPHKRVDGLSKQTNTQTLRGKKFSILRICPRFCKFLSLGLWQIVLLEALSHMLLWGGRCMCFHRVCIWGRRCRVRPWVSAWL